MDAGIFSGLKVVELAGVLAGPAVGQFFSELGAEVIKIENPRTGGDVTRSWKLRNENPRSETSAYFWSVNAGKKFLSIDLTDKAQQEKALQLLAEADIVISNYKAGDAEKLGTDYQTLHKTNPALIYASVTGFGHTSSRAAYDLILQAESGFMFMNGEKNSRGLKMPVALIDLLAAHQLKEAILIALLKREKSGKGCHVTVSLFHSAIASLANQATNWLVASHLPQPSGSLHPNIAPYGELFDTKDKQLITFAIGSNKQFEALCEIIGYPVLARQSRFSSNHSRVSNRDELYALLYDYVHKLDFNYLYDACLRKHVPIGKIRNLKEVFALQEAQEMIKEFNFGGQKVPYVSQIAFNIIQ